jgi:hypothetical protein
MNNAQILKVYKIHAKGVHIPQKKAITVQGIGRTLEDMIHLLWSLHVLCGRPPKKYNLGGEKYTVVI